MVLTKAINLAPRGHLPRHFWLSHWGAVTNGTLWMKARQGAKDPTTHKTKHVSVPNVHSAKTGKPGNAQEVRRPPLIGPVPGPISKLYVHHLTSLLKNSMRIHHSFVEKEQAQRPSNLRSVTRQSVVGLRLKSKAGSGSRVRIVAALLDHKSNRPGQK